MGHLEDELKVKLRWGNRIGFDKQGNIWRWRDKENGLWKRYVTILDKDGKARKGWGSTGEIIGEGVDKHFMTTNGNRVFMFEKELKK